MATLTDPITLQNMIDRFADYVIIVANTGIAWGTDVRPFPEFPSYVFGGPTSGQPTVLSGAGSRGTIINANNIYNAVLAETLRYSNIRPLRAILNVTVTGASPWNTGSRPGPGGIVFDQTRQAFLNTGYRRTGSLDQGTVVSGATITRAGLQALFYRAQLLYNSFPTETITINTCHASCHTSCHGSRVRR